MYMFIFKLYNTKRKTNDPIKRSILIGDTISNILNE